MHPVFTSRRRLGLYVLAWIPDACLLTYLFTIVGGISGRDGALLAGGAPKQIELPDAHDYTFSAVRRPLRYAPPWAIKLAMLPSMAAFSTASSASVRMS